jgi:hypothetical protein
VALPSVLLKLDRARHHISDLDTEVRNFLHSRPFEIDHHEHGNPQMAEWILTRETPVPHVISAIAGDAIQNLRTALDYIVCAMVERNQNRVSSESGFPISKSLAAYQNPNTQKKLDGISAEAHSFIDNLRPYAGGNDTLWLLHRLNNRDKHRLLLSAGCAVVEHDILPSQREQLRELYQRIYPNAPTPPFEGVRIKPETFSFPIQLGQVILSIPKKDLENNFRFRLGVALNEPGVPPGERIGDTLNRLLQMVGEISVKSEAYV